MTPQKRVLSFGSPVKQPEKGTLKKRPTHFSTQQLQNRQDRVVFCTFGWNQILVLQTLEALAKGAFSKSAFNLDWKLGLVAPYVLRSPEPKQTRTRVCVCVS